MGQMTGICMWPDRRVRQCGVRIDIHLRLQHKALLVAFLRWVHHSVQLAGSALRR